MAWTPEERAAHCKRIGALGGRATVARHGSQHMAEIGRLGFRAAMRSVGGLVLYEHLRPSYHQKFGGHDPKRCIDREEYRRREKARRKARTADPDPLCTVCGSADAELHHPNIDNDPDRVVALCRDHHQQEHRHLRQLSWEASHGA